MRSRLYLSVLMGLFCTSLLLWGCGVDGGGGASGANLVGSAPLINTNGLNGSSNIIAVSYTDVSNAGAQTGFKETLKLYQQASSDPDQLIELSSVYLGVDTLYHRVTDISLNDQWATITMNNNDTRFVTSVPAWVALISLANPPNFSLNGLLSASQNIDRAIAGGNWLLVAAGTSLALYDITSLTAPVLKKSFSLSSTTTSLVALSNGFFVITNNGYGFIDLTDPNNITLTEKADLDIKQSMKAYLIGNKLYIGGPSKFVGRIKIARLDLITPTNPLIDFLADQIQGTFVDFAFDGNQSYFVLATDSVQLFQEANNALSLIESAPILAFPRAASQFYAWMSRFYTTQNGVSIYKMP